MKNSEVAFLLLLLIGLLIALVPAKVLILFDRRSGYEIYRQVFKSTGSKEQALLAAAKFYRLIGLSFTVISFVLLIIVRTHS